MRQKTLQTQYNLIKEGKGNKEIFLKEAKRIFPNYVPNAATFNQAEKILKQKSIISENMWGITTGRDEKPDWFKIFNNNMNVINEAKSLENIIKSIAGTIDGNMIDIKKAVMDKAKEAGLEVTDDEVEIAVEKQMDQLFGLFEAISLEDIIKSTTVDGSMIDLKKAVMDKAKEAGLEVTDDEVEIAFKKHTDIALGLFEAKENKTSKEVTDLSEKNFDYNDKKNVDNVYGEAFLKGYYCEMKDPKNVEKTIDEIKEIVAKNLAKDQLYYVKDGQFGVKGVGYTDEHPGLKASKSDQMEKVKLQESKILNESSNFSNTYIAIFLPNGRISPNPPIKVFTAENEGNAQKIANTIFSNDFLYSHFSDSKVAIYKILPDGETDHIGRVDFLKPQPMNENKHLNESSNYSNTYIAMFAPGGDVSRQPSMKIFTAPSSDKAVEMASTIFGYYGSDSSSFIDVFEIFPDDEVAGAGVAQWVNNVDYVKPKLNEGMSPQGIEKLKPKKKKVKKETIDSKLAEIDKASNIVALEAKIEALSEIIESKTQRLNLVSEDESLSELMDKKKIKDMQKEIKLLEKKKEGLEKLYEKSCGKKYQQQEIVDEDYDPDQEQLDESKKKIIEGELKLGIKYKNKKTGDEGYIMTGGSGNPNNWEFSANREPYMSIKNLLEPVENQPGKYDGAFDMGMGKGHHIDESGDSRFKEMQKEPCNHQWVKIDKDGTKECKKCGLRKSN